MPICNYPCVIPSLLGASCRFATDGTHKDYRVKPWSGKACQLIALKSEVPDTETNEARVSDNPLRIPPLSLHCPSTILSKVEPVVGLGLLACPSCSSRQLCRLRNLHQFALNSCDNT